MAQIDFTLSNFKTSMMFGLPMIFLGPVANSLATQFSGIGEPFRSIFLFLAVIAIFAGVGYFIYKIPAKKAGEKVKNENAILAVMGGAVVLFLLSPVFSFLIGPTQPLQCGPIQCGGIAPGFNELIILLFGVFVIIGTLILYIRSR
jgi:uncharacterized YccA/Bax inhibitor family protein